MTIAATLQQHLSRQGIAFDVLTHAPTYSASQTAQASHVSGNKIAKAVLLRDERGFLLAVLPASHHIQFSDLREWLSRHLVLATEQEANALFRDCETGALPAIGAAYGLEVVVEETLANQPDIYFEGGDHATLLHLKGLAFEQLMAGARHGRFTFAG
jgi:Ala-tRNA(Pro) deacylase